MLGPEEQFTLLNLSGSTPKRQNVIRAICLLLGPDFSTDIVEIKTADHARLSVKLSYNWYFDTKNKDPKEASKLFNVPDFVGGRIQKTFKYIFRALKFEFAHTQTHAKLLHQE